MVTKEKREKVSEIAAKINNLMLEVGKILNENEYQELLKEMNDEYEKVKDRGPCRVSGCNCREFVHNYLFPSPFCQRVWCGHDIAIH
jgi:hypothetical protein